MAAELFVDTGPWVALADEDDRYHARAASAFSRLLTEYQRLVTTNLVAAECYLLLRLGLGHGPAVAFLDHLRASPRIERAAPLRTWTMKRRGSCAATGTRASAIPTP
ncbi:MAG: hypothetical protein HZB55_19835 [Deltaproteobacteria bacterium]|nr:hypothetical protein [Deltaproteobacteria bacterium]